MILPTATSSIDPLIWARQLILDVGTAPPVSTSSSINNPPAADSAPVPKLLNPPSEADTTAGPEEEGPGTIYITTKKPSPSSGTGTGTTKSKQEENGTTKGEGESEKGILAQAVADSNLSWWQLICVAIAGALVIGVAVWALFRQRRKKREDEERKKEVEALEKAAAAEAGAEEGKDGKGRVKVKGPGEGNEGSDESGWSSGDYDSFSDGGTIRPRRRQRRRRKRDRYRWGNRRRRRDSYYSSSEEESDYSYRPSRRHQHRHRSPTPSPPSPARDRVEKRKTFRDSVFSTFQSMKHAAIRSKQDEMETRLRKQLEDEARIEAVRQKKVKEANDEIKREREWFELEKEKEKLRMEKQMVKKRAGSGDSAQLLIPPAPAIRPPSSASGSSGRRAATRQASYPLPTPRRQPSVPAPPTARVRMPPRGATVDSVWPPPGDELGSDIYQLLGTKPKPVPIRQGTVGGALLSESGKGAAQSLPVKPTRDRPNIPKGGLAPAPKGKKKAPSPDLGGAVKELEIPEVVGMDHGWPTSKPALKALGSTGASSIGRQTPASGSGNKWADRMRARR